MVGNGCCDSGLGFIFIPLLVVMMNRFLRQSLQDLRTTDNVAGNYVDLKPCDIQFLLLCVSPAEPDPVWQSPMRMIRNLGAIVGWAIQQVMNSLSSPTMLSNSRYD